MTNVREAAWWNDCVAALRFDALCALALRYGVDEAVLALALAAESANQPAELSVWWPEAERMRATSSLRAIARLFHTEPRRIRRALARLNLRVGGREVTEEGGVAQLSGLRDMLGREPDRVVARMGGVIPEAVQGERKRLAIPAYVQRRRVRLSREEEAWIRGPKRGRRAKVHVEENLEVVRRPARTDENAHRPSGWGVGHADPRPRPSGEFVVRPPRVDRDFFRSQGPDELERLLQPVRQRDGRQRIVRGEPVRGAGDSNAPVGSPPSRPEPASRPSPAPLPRAAAPRSLRPALTDTRSGEGLVALEPLPRLPRGPVRRLAEPPVQPPAPARLAPTSDEWLVYVPGNDTPLRVHAADIVQAIAAAARIVPPELLRLASVWRADES